MIKASVYTKKYATPSPKYINPRWGDQSYEIQIEITLYMSDKGVEIVSLLKSILQDYNLETERD